ncbi:riboflavin synthase [Alkalicoccus daliensis]|uniref:Riboflavin synthase n=1 Tax=Alkalicoccus daliensis TaxID=745820 RepID=A0A1H0AZD6_9BACI|nr:riboflavin synthase [Alkalicoccus daliensis]SDN38729.1 riboflavin synthase alpha chain [Alkalicoccus daliensis]
MFTGIIEEKGKVLSMQQTGEAIVLSVEAPTILKDVKLGDSISVNGVCLTVTSYTAEYFTVDLMPETVRGTSLRNIKEGSQVNLERAMAAGGRFGGHFVSGHVDGVGKIRSKESDHNAVYYTIEIPLELRKYFTMKGSVSVDGTSLTVFGLTDNSFTISIIPHTLEETVIGQKEAGDIVNVECDMLAKYVEELLLQRFQSENSPETMSEEFLKNHGF